MNTPTDQAAPPAEHEVNAAIKELLPKLVERTPGEAVKLLAPYPDSFVVEMLALLNPSLAQNVLKRLSSERRQKVIAAAPVATRQQWMRNEAYPDQTVGHMMEPPLAMFSPQTTVSEATEALRHFVTRAFITYAFVVDEKERLLGVVAMREMLLARRDQTLVEHLPHHRDRRGDHGPVPRPRHAADLSPPRWRLRGSCAGAGIH